MRNRSITAVLVAAAAVVSGCAVAPGPVPAKPAPQLPADSISYDELPVITSRPPLFPNDCSQFEKDPQLLGQLSGSKPFFSPYTKTCEMKRADGATISVGAMVPNERVKEVWPGFWKVYSYSVYHFRRFLLMDRYYAISQLSQHGCEIAVNTGSEQVVTLTISTSGPNLSLPGDSVEQDRQMAAQFCPDAEKAMTAYLTTVDPGGGSLAAR
ncbi:hypothetical protein [Amycolatopsis benzoatilytica]|uniref:hypothetical protein n=1 Tax=Amycolatopsis benzoatilytica TaxID=346045 RepID=UPI001B7F8099|nr:hypothetical protein [Amycolatopsis benzoatilytica]